MTKQPDQSQSAKQDAARQARLEKIVLDPCAHFNSAAAVLEDPEWTRAEKRRILLSMVEEANELSTATAENMPGGEQIDLKPIKDALRALDTDD